MKSKVEIIICLGSSCFSRGNKQYVRVLQDYLNKNNLQDKVDFRGAHCCGKCEHGPILQINDQVYEQVDANSILEIVQKHMGV